MAPSTSEKNCYCHTCKRFFHYLGIANHRKKHTDAGETVEITYTNGNTRVHADKSRAKKP